MSIQGIDPVSALAEVDLPEDPLNAQISGAQFGARANSNWIAPKDSSLLASYT